MVKNVNVGKDNLKIELAIKTQNDEKKKTVVDEIENKLSPYFKQLILNFLMGPIGVPQRKHHSLQFNRNLIWIILKM
ncbi:MAG: hypothetical protein CM1200mP10_29610 [Candidatus Neomarinimicrobiota bacterium]|nr:MAG: hypothetical protein CM1200mP10_29610 [Candidatus Neomarinimicrobiota bacterium]